jgi:putative tryptophan/tyrosine transport system substrate-binding protein
MSQTRQANSIRQILFLILFTMNFVFLNGCGEKAHKKAYKVGILCGLDYIAVLSDGFKAKMTELGYVEGENIIYNYQRTNFEPEKEEKILRQFIEDKSDLILTFPTEVSMAAKAATQGTNVPVIFAIANIESTDLVDSVIKPGGQITGVRFPGPDLAIKRFEVMRELVPKAKRMWVPYQRGYPIISSQMKVLYPVAEAAGITLIEFPADNAAEIRAELDARQRSNNIDFDAIFFIPEPISCTDDAFAVMCNFAYEQKIPIGGILMQAGNRGSIFGINVNIRKTGEQAAVLADKILNGTLAGTIPVLSSESYLEINYKVAQELGVPVPEGLLSRADRIIR